MGLAYLGPIRIGRPPKDLWEHHKQTKSIGWEVTLFKFKLSLAMRLITHGPLFNHPFKGD